VSEGDLRAAALRLDQAAGIVLGLEAQKAVPDAQPIARFTQGMLEAPSGFEPEMEVLQPVPAPRDADGTRCCPNEFADRDGAEWCWRGLNRAGVATISLHSPAGGHGARAALGPLTHGTTRTASHGHRGAPDPAPERQTVHLPAIAQMAARRRSLAL
jgi:hypothetical protein